jgi:predicted metal-dependent phosphoesterase TrpH
LPVLAHPLTINNYHAVTAELAAAGLAGMEVYYKDFTAGERQDLLSLALRLNLVATGGSDYHGIDDTIEVLPGNAQVPDTVISQIIKRAAENSIKVPSTLEKYIC